MSYDSGQNPSSPDRHTSRSPLLVLLIGLGIIAAIAAVVVGGSFL